MGYDLRITRATDWMTNHGREISAAEWRAVVEADPDLTDDPANGPLAARFGEGRWFDWFEGNVFTTDPDQVTVVKMLQIAERLSAGVQGDEGEFYDTAAQWDGGRANAQRGREERG